ncbi:MAG: signal recognition particle receptor subunit alpha, partial [Lysobacter sp.]|nr:signal recognition particle receptor subunit alpha [Lysobacter sp.]
MVSLFRRKKPEPATSSTRRYSIEELAAAFPTATAQSATIEAPPPAETRTEAPPLEATLPAVEAENLAPPIAQPVPPPVVRDQPEPAPAAKAAPSPSAPVAESVAPRTAEVPPAALSAPAATPLEPRPPAPEPERAVVAPARAPQPDIPSATPAPAPDKPAAPAFSPTQPIETIFPSRPAAVPAQPPGAAPVAPPAAPVAPPSAPAAPASIPTETREAAPATPGKLGWRERLRGSGFARNFGGLFSRNPQLDEALLEEIETALITADVGVSATTQLVEALRKRMNSREFADAKGLLAALRAELIAMLKPVSIPLHIRSATKPFVILTVGVNGVGKTTTIGKLAHRFRAENHSLMLAAGDTFRAAAVAQLQAWGDRNGVAVIAQGSNNSG